MSKEGQVIVDFLKNMRRTNTKEEQTEEEKKITQHAIKMTRLEIEKNIRIACDDGNIDDLNLWLDVVQKKHKIDELVDMLDFNQALEIIEIGKKNGTL